ncbi:MAG: eukaryotic-like serine/threonine-protein kinase [Thermomicrobiales bacterium]|nr:eukaryotic-like serine/threonine-protein kinase [Thermomicrobiales bacterium]
MGCMGVAAGRFWEGPAATNGAPVADGRLSRFVADGGGPVARLISLVSLVVIAATLGPSPGAPKGSAQEEAAPFDLAAMPLVPADAEAAGLEGFGIASVTSAGGTNAASGWMELGHVAEESIGIGDDGTQTGKGRFNYELHAAGWQRQYRRVLSEPGGMSIFSSVGQYATNDGAASAFATLTTSADAEEVTSSAVLGDRSAIHRDILYGFGRRLVLTFQVDNLLADVQVIRGPDDDQERAEALAQRLLARIDAARGSREPGLARLALRLAVPPQPGINQSYGRLAGETLAMLGESQQDRTEREIGYGDADAVYWEVQRLPLSGEEEQSWSAYRVQLLHFRDEKAAADWLDGVPSLLEELTDASFRAEPIAGSTPVGDESLAFAVEFPGEKTRRGPRMYTRVGPDVARIELWALEAPPLAAVESLAAAQVACLRAAACSDPVPAPNGLPGAICPDAVAPAVPAGEAGDVPMAGANPAQTGEHPGPGPVGEPLQRWRFEVRGEVEEAPVVSDGIVYVGTTADTFYAIEMTTGELRWCRQVGFVGGAAAVAGDIVIVDHRDERRTPGHVIVGLDRATGAERWRIQIFGWASDLVIADGVAYVGTGDGAILALDAATGAARWRFALEPDERGLGGFGRPAVADGTVYASGSGKDEEILYAIDAETGNERWRFSGDHDGPAGGSPVVADGMIFFGSLGGVVGGLNAQTGEVRWRFEAAGPTSATPAVVDGVLYAASGSKTDDADGDAYLYAVDIARQDELWRYEVRDYVAPGASPAVAGGVVYVGDGAGVVHAVDAVTGQAHWTYETADSEKIYHGIDGTPAVVGGFVVAGGSDDALHGISGNGG